MKYLSKLKNLNLKAILAILAGIGIAGGCIFHYTVPQWKVETESRTLEERQAITDEVKDYLVKYVVSNGFVEDISESEDLQTLLAEKMKSGELMLLDEEQIDAIARYAAENYNDLLDSNIDTLTDEQIAELEKKIRDNIEVTIGDQAAEVEEDVSKITGGVSSIVVKNILARLEQMDQSIKALQEDLNSIKESITLGSSLTDVSSSIGRLEDRLDYVKNNLTEEDAALAGDIEDIEEELRTLHVNVDETATVVVQLESTMDDLTRSSLDSLSGQMNEAGVSIDRINKDFQSILDKITALQGAMNNKDSELNQIVKESTDKIADVSGLISALQKELTNYKSNTDKSLKNLQDTQTVLDKNLTNYKNTTNSTLTDLSNGQNTINRKFSEYQDSVNAEIINIYTLLQNMDQTQQGYDVDLSEISRKLKELDEGLNQCFTSVSSGKVLLASAVTDKGIETDAAETFSEIANGIRRIGEEANVLPGAILAGYKAYANSRYIEGNIPNQGAVFDSLNCGEAYTVPSGYHNGEGKITANTLASQTPATATAANLSRGTTGWVNGRLVTGSGADNTTAYNNGYAAGMNDVLSGAGISCTYHTHSGSASAYGGCYTTPVYHVHTESCYSDVPCSCSGYSQGEYLGEHAIDGWPMWACNHCPHINASHNGSGKCTSTTRVLSCGKTEATIEFYDLGCGKTEATIESATVVFP